MLKSCSFIHTYCFFILGLCAYQIFRFLCACIDNKCYIVYLSQRHSAEQHVIYNEVKYFSLGVPLLVVTLHGTAPQNTNCNCSVLIIHVLILRWVCVPVPVLMNLYCCVKQDFVANAKQYYIRALNKNVLLPFLFCSFSFCVCM